MSVPPLQDVMAFNTDADSSLPFPIIADDKRELSVQLGMLDPDERDKDGLPLTARCVRNCGFVQNRLLIGHMLCRQYTQCLRLNKSNV